jgi:RHH-type rel operon transcriptional repressor/antitoxin RelB
VLAIRLPAAIEKRLDRLAKRTGRTKTYYAREAILKHLEDLREGRSHTVPLEEVMRKHGNLKD